jgi:glycolate dehydrogenase FAD-linked subunit
VSAVGTDAVGTLIASFCREIVGAERVFTSDADCACYSYDAYLESARPDCVAVPASAAQVAKLVASCGARGVPYVARGAGTGYAGGAVPIHGGLVILLTDLRDLQINREARWAWVGAGVTTAMVAQAASAHGLRYPPDPSSYAVSTIGGNVATNAGGPHCLGHGVTTSYVMEIEVVGSDGRVRRFGGLSTLCARLDLRGLLIGSEGTLGIITGARLRLIATPESIRTIFASFERPEEAIAAIEDLFAAGIVPEALDLTCGVVAPGTEGPTNEGPTIAYVDVEGFRESVDARVVRLVEVFERRGGLVETMSRGDLMGRRFAITLERWRNVVTKTHALRYFLFDALTPRSRLREVLRRIAAGAHRHGLHVANTFHAGDGNIHPTPFFDPTLAGSRETLVRFWKEVLADVAELGGVLSGEHGIGIEKVGIMPQFFGDAELAVIRRIKRALDPSGLCNPGKVVPRGASCQRPERHERWFSRDRVRARVVDGYVEASGECTRAQIAASLEGSPYELAFDPVGWDAGMTLAEAVALGRPGWSERLRGPCRDHFLGGRFASRALVLGSPFAKDVSAYDLRKIAYGSGALFGSLDRAWLRISPRPTSRYEGLAHTTLERGRRALRELDRTSAPFRTLALVGWVSGAWSILCVVEGEKDLVQRTLVRVGEKSRAMGVKFEWRQQKGSVPSNCAGRRYWTWYEATPWEFAFQDLGSQTGIDDAQITDQSRVVVALTGSNVVAVEREAWQGGDVRKIWRPEEEAVATALSIALADESAEP